MEKIRLHTNIRCIILDDEIEACDRLESILKNIENIEVDAKIVNADEGIKRIVELLPDIVFLDVEMPGKSGFDVVKDVRAQKINPTFIFVTGYNQYAVKAIRNAAFDYLLKPVDLDELKEAIERFRCAKEEKEQYRIPEKLKTKFSLTPREIEIIELIAQCKSSKGISEILFISRHTVDTHRRNILVKTGMRTTNDLLNFIYKL